jgi:hypothetical protein
MILIMMVIDVFIGSRSVPGVYGLIQHMLLEMMEREIYNNIEKVAFKLNDVGMVTDAVWEDIDNDSKRFNSGWRLDGAKIFKNNGRRLADLNLT